MAEIFWSDLAKRHLREIDSYVAQGSRAYSIVFIDRLLSSVERIGRFPESGRIVPEFERDDIREIFFGKYRIVYRIQGEKLHVLAVVHGAMDITKRHQRERWEIG
jgi:toxin ParE1/3/4